MRISDWSSDVCSSDLSGGPRPGSHSRAGRASIGPVTTRAYTDGACSGNPGPGGWAWAVPDGHYASGAAAQTPNQRLEITADRKHDGERKRVAVRVTPGGRRITNKKKKT